MKPFRIPDGTTIDADSLVLVGPPVLDGSLWVFRVVLRGEGGWRFAYVTREECEENHRAVIECWLS